MMTTKKTPEILINFENNPDIISIKIYPSKLLTADIEIKDKHFVAKDPEKTLDQNQTSAKMNQFLESLEKQIKLRNPGKHFSFTVKSQEKQTPPVISIELGSVNSGWENNHVYDAAKSIVYALSSQQIISEEEKGKTNNKINEFKIKFPPVSAMARL